jgi:hypothetical protein
MEVTSQNGKSVEAITESGENTVLSNLIDEQIYRLDIDSKDDGRLRKKRKWKI